MFGSCLSWSDWATVQQWVDVQLSSGADKVAFDMVPTLFMALGYQGLNGNGNTVPEFYNNVAELGVIISGAASATFAGMKLLEVAVKNESWAQNSVSIGAIFDSYGDGNTASGVPVM